MPCDYQVSSVVDTQIPMGRRHRFQQLSTVASHAVVPDICARVGVTDSIRGQLDQDKLCTRQPR
jgi:hypothetical protein